MNAVTIEYAETLAAQALVFLTQDKKTFEGFLAVSGVDVSQIGSLADDPQFLAAVLDYTLSKEQIVLEFCEQMEIDPDLPKAARRRLPGVELGV